MTDLPALGYECVDRVEGARATHVIIRKEPREAGVEDVAFNARSAWRRIRLGVQRANDVSPGVQRAKRVAAYHLGAQHAKCVSAYSPGVQRAKRVSAYTPGVQRAKRVSAYSLGFNARSACQRIAQGFNGEARSV